MELEQIFRNKKLKLTKPRREVAEVLIAAGKPLCLEDVHKGCTNADFSSVFRNIKLFESLGLVEEINFGDRKPCYEFILNRKHHHHIRCEICGRIDRIDNICLVNKVKKETDYEVTHHNIEFTGVCPQCKTK